MLWDVTWNLVILACGFMVLGVLLLVLGARQAARWRQGGRSALAWLAERTRDRNELIRSWKADFGGARKGRGGEYLQKVEGAYASLA
jgi:hypothetical protein